MFSPTPPPLPQKGCTPHLTGTARVITHGKKSDSFPKLAVARKGWVRGGCPGGLLLTSMQMFFFGGGAQQERGRQGFSNQNRPSQIPWPFKTSGQLTRGTLSRAYEKEGRQVSERGRDTKKKNQKEREDGDGVKCAKIKPGIAAEREGTHLAP